MGRIITLTNSDKQEDNSDKEKKAPKFKAKFSKIGRNSSSKIKDEQAKPSV
jgi:hypothetical protein